MARIAIGSAFRNSGGNAMVYMERVAALRDLMQGDQVRVIAVEGDSRDNTREALRIAARFHNLDLDLLTCNHGGPVFGSTEQPERLKALSLVGNAIFDGVRESDDALLYVESDLLWDAWTAKKLILRAINWAMTNTDVVAPMVMAGEAFYDIWGFRHLSGERFGPFEHQKFGGSPVPIRVGSVGSCLAMRGEVARRCRIKNDYCLVGWCEDARAQGFSIAAHPDLVVRQL